MTSANQKNIKTESLEGSSIGRDTRVSVPLFSRGDRASGLLLHVTSLPSPYGIGDFGPAALSWIDRLDQAGQSWWQALPLGPTGYGNSPYQPLSSFAGNALLISPDWLIEDGLIEAKRLRAPSISCSRRRLRCDRYRLSIGCWKRLGTTSGLAPALTSVQPMSNSVMIRIIGWRTMPCSGR